MTATWNVSSEMGCAVLFDIREFMRMVSSLWRETLKTVLMALFVTVMAFGESGSADVKVQSSSAGAVAGGGGLLAGGGVDVVSLKSKSAAPGEGAGLMDWWNWNGDAVRGVDEVRAANGSVGFCEA